MIEFGCDGATVAVSSQRVGVRYRDLCADSVAALERIFRHLGVGYDPAYFKDDQHASLGLRRWSGHQPWASRPGAEFLVTSVEMYKSYGIDWSFLGDLWPSRAFADWIGTRQ